MFEHVALMLVIYSFLERETMFVQILCGFVCSFNLVFCFPRSEGRERKGKEGRKEGRKLLDDWRCVVSGPFVESYWLSKNIAT